MGRTEGACVEKLEVRSENVDTLLALAGVLVAQGDVITPFLTAEEVGVCGIGQEPEPGPSCEGSRANEKRRKKKKNEIRQVGVDGGRCH